MDDGFPGTRWAAVDLLVNRSQRIGGALASWRISAAVCVHYTRCSCACVPSAHGIKAEQPLTRRVRCADPRAIWGSSCKAVPTNWWRAPPLPVNQRRVVSVLSCGIARRGCLLAGVLGLPYWHGGRNEQSTDWVSLQVPDGTDWLEYMLNAEPTPSLRQAGVMDHFSLGVVHMSDAVAALQRNKCEGANCTKTQDGRDGKVQLNLFDPDFTRVEYMEFTPSKEPCCSPFTGKHPSAEEDK